MDRYQALKGTFMTGGNHSASIAKSDEPMQRPNRATLCKGSFLTSDGGVAFGPRRPAAPRPAVSEAPTLEDIKLRVEKIRAGLDAFGRAVRRGRPS
jgi:hypothetical protein